MRTILVLCTLLVIVAGCHQNSQTLTPPQTSPLTTLEQSLVGKWNLKHIETRYGMYYQGLQDSTSAYMNRYNYSSSMFNFSSTATTVVAGHQQYSMTFGGADNASISTMSWYAEDNVIHVQDGNNSYFIRLRTTDSLILDQGTLRYFFSKNTIPPTTNQIETRLLGTWVMTTNSYYYMKFTNSWNSNGYLERDSTVFNPSNPIITIRSFEVLFPERLNPILVSSLNTTSTSGYNKIISLSSTTLIVQPFYPNTGVNNGNTLSYTKID